IFFVSLSHPTPIWYSALSLHDALPIWRLLRARGGAGLRHRPRHAARVEPRPARAGLAGPAAGAARRDLARAAGRGPPARRADPRSEEHTSELQSRENLVCRLLLEKKKH